MAGQSVCFLLHCLCGGPEPAQPIRHAALPLQAMDETSQHIKVSRNPLPKTPQGTYTYSVRPMEGTEPRCVAGAGELVEGPQPDTICIGSLRGFWQRISRDFDVL